MSYDKYFRKVFLAGIYMLGIFGIVASNGDGDGDDDDGELVISENYSFQIGGPLEGGAGNSSIGIVREGGITLTVEPDMQGELICDQSTEICELQYVYQNSSITITDQTNPVFVGDFVVTVEDTWFYNPLGTDQPVAGRFHVQEAGQPVIVVEFTNCQGSDDSEVQVTVNATVNCYQWDFFEDLFSTSGNLVERQASFGWEVAEYIVLEQGLSALDVFPLIIDGDFEGGNPLIEDCEIYTGMWAGGPVNPGNFTFFWDDDSGDNQVGSGDSFRLTFTDCWGGDSTEGALFNGGIDYVGYTQVIQDQLLTRIGFESAAQGSGKIGGVAFDSLEITETNENGGIITPEPKITLSGRYLVVFHQ